MATGPLLAARLEQSPPQAAVSESDRPWQSPMEKDPPRAEPMAINPHSASLHSTSPPAASRPKANQHGQSLGRLTGLPSSGHPHRPAKRKTATRILAR